MNTYTDEDKQRIMEEVCKRIMQGEPVRRITMDKEMPDRTTIYTWVRNSPEFQKMFWEAREIQAWGFADQMLDMMDEEQNPINRLSNGAYDSAHVTHVRNRVSTLQWVAKNHAPRKYGDLVKIAGDEEQAPIRISDSEAAHKISAILAGAKARREDSKTE